MSLAIENRGSNPDRRCKAPTPSECFGVVVGTLIIAAFMWLSVRAYMAVVVLPVCIEVRVNNVSVSPFNVSDSPLTSNWNIYFAIENPNEQTINCDSAGVSVFYDDHYVSYGNIMPFSQSGKNETVVEAGLKASSVHVDDKVSNSITTDMAALGAVEFQVYVDGIARTQPATDKEQIVRVRVYCQLVKILFISNSTTVVGTMVGGSRKCYVRYLR